MEKLNKLLEEYPNGKGDLDSLKFLRPFIKWLVDNDKIDFDKAYNGFITFHFHKGAGYRPDLVLIMLLSIQDSPIEFLVSILK